MPIAAADHLEYRHEPSGHRHYLADQPVHAGSFLEVLTDDGWVGGRYEWSFTPNDAPYLVLDEQRAVAIQVDDLLRWPAS